MLQKTCLFFYAHQTGKRTFAPALARFIAALFTINLLLPGTTLASSAKQDQTITTPTEPTTTTETLQFTSDNHVLDFSSEKLTVSNGTYALNVAFVQANEVIPQALVDSSEISNLNQVTYSNLWPGITLTYDANNGLARSTYTLEPGAYPANIRLRYNTAASVANDGSLHIEYETGEMIESTPIAWQEINGTYVPVDVAFQATELENGSTEISFILGSYDIHYTLTIDPTLEWHTFLGGSGTDYGNALAVDSNGNIYVTGYSNTTWGSSPVRAYTGSDDVFVAKLASDGSLIWHTFLGSSNLDTGNAIALDAAGNIYVAGASCGTWGETPVRVYASGANDAFVAKLANDGTLIWHTFLGGSDSDGGSDLVVDANDNVYVTGGSEDAWPEPPVRAYTGSTDAFVAKLASDGTLIWHTFLGSWNGADNSNTLAIDTSSNVYISGHSNNPWNEAPIRAYSGDGDAYAAKLASDGSLIWYTFLGGSDNDNSAGIAVDSSSNVYVTGFSQDSWAEIPVRAYSGNQEAFVAKLTSDGALAWHTFLGSSNLDSGSALVVDSTDSVYVTGTSYAIWTETPVRTNQGSNDAFVAKLANDGNLIWHTFLGGSSFDYGRDIAIDDASSVYVLGLSNAAWTESPVRIHSRGLDAFVAKLGPSSTITAIIGDSPTPSPIGESYTVTVTVSTVGGIPTGTVNVDDGESNNIITLSDGTGACTLTSTSVGTKTITATYSGDTDFSASTDTESHIINQANTTTTIVSTEPDTTQVGESYTISVTVASTGIVTPTGTVIIDDGENSNTIILSDGSGSCTLPSTSAGTKTLTASYSGDDNFNPSSDTTSHTVNRADTITTISTDAPNPSQVGESYTVTITVTSAGGTPTGTVEVSDGGGNTAATITLSDGSGSCTLPSTSVGTKTLTATYSGDDNFNDSSVTTSHTINQANTITIITGDTPDPSLIGESYAITVTVTSAGGTPTGTVEVSDGEGNSATITLVDGSGSCTLPSTSAGTKTLTATYSGDNNFNASSDTASHEAKWIYCYIPIILSSLL